MTSLRDIVVRHVHVALVWCASLLVPRAERSEWSEEWLTELWYVLRECSSETSVRPRPLLEASSFCIGAYQDAIWVRKRAWHKRQPHLQIRISAPVCLLILMAMLFSSWGIARLSSRVVAVNEMARIRVYPWRLSDGLAKPSDCTLGTRAENDVQTSLGSSQRYFDGFSHYSVAQHKVWGNTIPRTEWTVAHTRSNFFAVTKLSLHPIQVAQRDMAKLPQIVLSQETWRRDFGGKQNIAGTELRIDSVDAVVAGVASGGSAGLPGKANAWLLGGPQVGSNNAEFVVGHLSPAGYFQLGPRWALSLFGIALATLLMPWLTDLSIGEYGSGSQKPSFVRRAQFWAFLTAKIFLLLAITYFVSVDLDCTFLQPSSRFSGYIQFASSFTFGLLGLRWAVCDQRERCPICLRRMANPAQVGEPSRTFLAWRGTELVCEHGHVLLYIPEFSTSWFDGQRWVCLDRSWQFLFARPRRM
jgi:hypothetical protein